MKIKASSKLFWCRAVPNLAVIDKETAEHLLCGRPLPVKGQTQDLRTNISHPATLKLNEVEGVYSLHCLTVAKEDWPTVFGLEVEYEPVP